MSVEVIVLIDNLNVPVVDVVAVKLFVYPLEFLNPKFLLLFTEVLLRAIEADEEFVPNVFHVPFVLVLT